MLSNVVRPDGSVVSFTYDALGRRVSKTYRGQTTKWIWDGDNPLHEWVSGALQALPEATVPIWTADAESKKREAELQQHLSQGPPSRGTKENPITWLFDPESFSPMAKLVGGEQYSIVTDHLGTPVMMSDSSGTAVWSASMSAYGELRELDGERHMCPFRWPGQYEDAETGLYYNRFRYYDTEAGAYVSPDPIAPSGGLALYAYVRDPLAFVDVLGLACKSAVSARKGRAKAAHDLERNGFTVVSEEVTMIVNGKRIRADFVRDSRGKLHVFEVKHGSGRLTQNQAASGVFDMGSPSNTTQHLGGGTIRPGQGTPGSMTVATHGDPGRPLGGHGATHPDTTFHVLTYT